MARAARLSKRKFKTDSVQGPGSYITFRKPAFGDAQEFVRELREATVGIGDREKGPQIEDEMTIMIFDVASSQFDSWNWVDDDDKPLPDFDEIDDIGEVLLQEEVDVIIDSVRNLYGIVEDDREGKSIV